MPNEGRELLSYLVRTKSRFPASLGMRRSGCDDWYPGIRDGR
jgi:hypothetical protein